ncbi:hypothetical protein L1887_14888 [Cichorium endivia]|nr:hypothetical protein L1887_14888 [Cichorium endivia]
MVGNSSIINDGFDVRMLSSKVFGTAQTAVDLALTPYMIWWTQHPYKGLCLPRESQPELPVTIVLHLEDFSVNSSSLEEPYQNPLASFYKKSPSSRSPKESSSDESSIEETPKQQKQSNDQPVPSATFTSLSCQLVAPTKEISWAEWEHAAA